MKVVINTCYGGYNLSTAALVRWAELQGIQTWVVPEDREAKRFFDEVLTIPPDSPELVSGSPPNWHGMSMDERKAHNALYDKQRLSYSDIERHNPFLVQVVEEMGETAGGRLAQLKIVEIPDGTDYEIDEYDGLEHIAEKHRTWS